MIALGDDLLAGGAKVRGVNLTVEPSADWVDLWTDWDWDGWIKQQIDRVATLDGVNVIRAMGSYQAVHDGLSEATYLARWAQLAAYVDSLGLRLYPCGGDRVGDTPYVAPYYDNSFVSDLAIATISAVSDYDPIGFDIVNEQPDWARQSIYGGAVASSIRAAHPTVPLTMSRAVTTDALASQLYNFASVSPFVDFHDVHVFGTLTSTIFNAYWTQETKPLLLGEYGAPVSDGQAAQEARYNAVKAILNNTSQGRRLAGGLAWAAQDQGTADADKFGLFANDGTERTYLTSIFESMPTG